MNNLDESAQLTGSSDNYLVKLKIVIEKLAHEDWFTAQKLLMEAWQSGTQVIIAGNGGNFANALHFATDWKKGLYFSTKKSMLAEVVGQNIVMQSAYENDLEHFDAISAQLKSIYGSGVFLGLSAGGDSKNIHYAVMNAKKMGLTTIGILGPKSLLCDLSNFDVKIVVNSENIMIVEDVTSMFGHSVKNFIESEYTRLK